MAVITIENFGGEMPSVSPRALPGGAAQENRNLYQLTNEFRPQKDDASVGAGAAGAKSLYRVSSSSPWVVKTGPMSYVKGQIDEDPTVRTYFTTDDGSAAPGVIDVSNAVRQLGVPAPTVAPSVSLNATDELRVDELPAASDAFVTLIASAIEAALAPSIDRCGLNLSAPTATSAGWRAHSSDETNNYLDIPYVNGALLQGFEPFAAKLFGGIVVTVGGVQYLRVDLNTGARIYTPSNSALTQSLAGMMDPALPTERLMDDASVAFIVGEVSSYYGYDDPAIAKLVSSARTAASVVNGMLSGLTSGLSWETFYASATYTSKVDALIGNGTTGVVGSVTRQIMDYLYILVGNTKWGDASNVNNNDNPAAWVTGYASQGTPDGWWEPDTPGSSWFTDDEGLGKIRTSILGFVKTGANGIKELDYGALRAKVLVNYNDLVNRRPTVDSKNYYAARVGKWVDDALAPLKSFFDPVNQKNLALNLTGGTDAAVSIGTAFNNFASALDALASEYVQRKGLTNTIARNAYDNASVSTKGRQQGQAVVALIDTRYYIYTYVTDWNEESAPSPVSERLEVDQNDTVTVGITAPPAERHIQKWRLYRSNSGSTSTAFQFVGEFDVSARTYEDAVKASDLLEPCPSVAWLEPPQKLRGLVGMPNGVMAGYFDNTVCFCEPYIPYAWPVEYQLTTEHPIVGLGVYGQTLFVGTTGRPYLISGADSASMSQIKTDSAQSCASARSIVSIAGGVVFASPDGLCLASNGGISLLTAQLFAREDWQKLDPTTMFASHHEDVYYLFYQGAGGGCLTLDFAAKKLGRIDAGSVTAVYSELLTDALYALDGTEIKHIHGGSEHRLGKWHSPKIVMPQQVSVSWLKVYGDQTVSDPATVEIYADGALRHTATAGSIEPQRLPSGRWLEYEIVVKSKARITRVVLAGSTQELQSV